MRRSITSTVMPNQTAEPPEWRRGETANRLPNTQRLSRIRRREEARNHRYTFTNASRGTRQLSGSISRNRLFFTNHTPMPKAIPTKNLFLFTFRRMVAQVTPPKGFPCIGFNINGVPISTHQSRSGNTIAGIRTTGAGLYATFARRQKSINVFKPATLKPRINAIQTVFYIPRNGQTFRSSDYHVKVRLAAFLCLQTPNGTDTFFERNLEKASNKERH